MSIGIFYKSLHTYLKVFFCLFQMHCSRCSHMIADKRLDAHGNPCACPFALLVKNLLPLLDSRPCYTSIRFYVGNRHARDNSYADGLSRFGVRFVIVNNGRVDFLPITLATFWIRLGRDGSTFVWPVLQDLLLQCLCHATYVIVLQSCAFSMSFAMSTQVWPAIRLTSVDVVGLCSQAMISHSNWPT